MEKEMKFEDGCVGMFVRDNFPYENDRKRGKMAYISGIAEARTGEPIFVIKNVDGKEYSINPKFCSKIN